MKGEIVKRIRRKLLVRDNWRCSKRKREREREKRFGRNFVTRRFKQKFLWLETRWPGRVYDN